MRKFLFLLFFPFTCFGADKSELAIPLASSFDLANHLMGDNSTTVLRFTGSQIQTALNLGQYYLASNPSSFITASALSPYATIASLGTAAFISTNSVVRGVTGSGGATVTTNSSGVVNVSVTGSGGDVVAANNNVLTGTTNSFTHDVGIGGSVYGTFVGNGSGITSLNASSLSSGTVPSGRLSLSESDINTTDVTTGNVTTSKHGYAPKLPNDSTKYLNGIGTYTVPPGGGDVVAANNNVFTGTTNDFEHDVGIGGLLNIRGTFQSSGGTTNWLGNDTGINNAYATGIFSGTLIGTLTGTSVSATSFRSTGSNYFSKALSFSTNQNQVVPDFSLPEQLMSTNAAFTFLAPAGVDTTKTEVQWTLVNVTNTTAVAVAITPPANCHGVGTLFVTNWSLCYFQCYAQKLTNLFCVPVF